MQNGRLPVFVKSSLAVAVATLLGSLSDRAAAQQPTPQVQGPEEILVTGSRIVRRDFEANSPIMTVDSDQFENTMSVGIETVMNQMPQFVPAVTPFTTTDVQASATNTPGASTLSLRGLGPNRNLVLLDGRRGMPVNALGAVSINSIPSAAVERVETITGGASSVYGADAMAGVVNFILKKNYEGVDFDVRYGQTLDGDGAEMRVSGVYGANFSDDKGNVLVGFEYATRDEVRARDRDWQTDIWRDPTVGTSFFAPTETAFVTEAGNLPNQAVANGIFDSCRTGNVSVATGQQFLPNLSVGTPAAQNGTLWKFSADGACRYAGFMGEQPSMIRKIRIDNEQPRPVTSPNGQVVEIDTTGLLEIPLERYAVFGTGRLAVADNVSAFVTFNFSEDETDTQLGDNYLGAFWGAYVPHGTALYLPSITNLGADGLPNTADPGENMATRPAYLPGGAFGLNCAATGGCTNSQTFPTTPELGALLDSRGNPEAPWIMSSFTNYAGKRTTNNDVQTYQLQAGFEGKLFDGDWTWEAYVSHGNTDVSTIFGGVISIERFRFLVDSPNYGRNAFFQGNPFSAAHIAGGTLTCQTGLPIMEKFAPSADCIEGIVADLQATSEMKQDIAEFNLQGKLVTMPAGDARFAAGVSHRRNDYVYYADGLASQSSFLDGAVGIFPGGNSIGETKVSDIYGELLLPLLKDKPAVNELNLELGYRSSDNDPSESVDTYKAQLDWRITDRIRIRGGHNVANRAPNIGELFEAKTQIVGAGGSVLGDLCNPGNTTGGTLSTNPALNPNAAQVRSMCEQQMGVTGAAAYYALGNVPVTSTLGNRTGNPTLHSEEGKTTTVGAVMRIKDSTSLSIDAYEIRIKDYISAALGESVFRECYDPVFNPTYNPFSAACNQIVRDPTNGNIAAVDVTYSNNPQVETRGVDVQFNWGTGMGAGNFNLNFLASFLDSFKTKLNASGPWTEWKGTFGPTGLAGVQSGAFDYRTFTTASYRKNDWNLALQWRHLPEIKPAAIVTSPNTTTIATPSYDIFDLSAGYDLRDQWRLRVGIDNLLDKQPVYTNATRFTRGTAVNGGFYDVLGRRAYVGFSLSF
jgi:outer membrane receptor protein involved in Fe transport